MLKDISKLKVTGAIFSEENELNLFDSSEEKYVKGTLLYGRNGTGKSTIAKAFRILSGEDISTIEEVKIYDTLNQLVTLTEEEKNSIFIFDEDYVDKNIKLKQDHLDTIVMLGPAADLTEKINKATDERDNAKRDYEQQQRKYEELQDSKNITSPEYYIDCMKNNLRGDDNWAGRDREINGSKNNTQVKNDTYKNFISLNPDESRNSLVLQYKEKINELNNTRTGVYTIDDVVPDLKYDYRKFSEEEVLELLSEKIEKPQLSEREKKLFDLLEKEGGRNDLSNRLETFKNENLTECPYCFRTITKEERKSLAASIEKILNKIVENHQNQLSRHILSSVEIDLEKYKKLKGYQDCIDLVGKVNNIIGKINENLKKKLENPYEPIIIEGLDFHRSIDQLYSALKELEGARLENNDREKITQSLVKELKQINNSIAYYDVHQYYLQYKVQKNEFEIVKSDYEEKLKDYELKQQEVEDLTAQMKRVSIAADEINACLKYIFFSDNRLSIEYMDGTYKLLSYGKSVNPKDISVGERNIIGLSYFFTSILENQDRNDAYDKEYLIVIDDPISSYDQENIIGILSFLKYKLGMFLEGNANTKALVMTHDLRAFYDITKIFDEIMNACKKKYKSNPTHQYKCYELMQKRLKDFPYKKRQEYTRLVETIYKYAQNQGGECETNELEFIIGNMIRQVLEAFSTFEYKKGIIDVSTDSQILNLLGNEGYILYFKNLMYRLLLNGDSHKEEQVQAMNDLNFFDLISRAEKQRTAKDVLCFIYLLNPRHLVEHLKNCGNIESTLKGWCNDILNRTIA